MSNSLQPHGRQHARLSCPSPSAEVCSNSRPLIWWWLFVYYLFITRKSSFPLRFRQNWVISSPTVSKDHRIPPNIFRVLPGWAGNISLPEGIRMMNPQVPPAPDRPSQTLDMESSSVSTRLPRDSAMLVSLLHGVALGVLPGQTWIWVSASAPHLSLSPLPSDSYSPSLRFLQTQPVDSAPFSWFPQNVTYTMLWKVAPFTKKEKKKWEKWERCLSP